MYNRFAAWAVAAGLIVGLGGCDSRSVGRDPAGECSVVGYNIEIRYLTSTSVDMSAMPLVASGGWVYYTSAGTTGANSPDDPEIYSVDTSSEQVDQLTADDEHTLLLDADGRAVLYRQSTGLWDQPSKLYLRTGDGEIVELGEHQDFTSDYGMSPYSLAPHRLLDDGRAAFSADGRVYLYEAGTLSEVFDSEVLYVMRPYLRDGVLVFASWDANDTEVYRYAEGALQQLTDNDTADEQPVASGGRVFWVCDGAICSWDRQDPQVRVLDEGLCTEPDTDQGQAAWICDGQVKLFDGEQVRALTDAEGDRDSVRLAAGRLVWIEIHAEEPPPEVYGVEWGTIVFSDGHDTWDVTDVGLPCIYCGAFWPPLSLSFTGEILAWTYAISDDPSLYPDMGEFSAYAKITPQTHCE